MKIGTDGVLLGSWIPLTDNETSILDVGTGTGVIALMLAQRSNAEIVDAIEIDPDAYEQAVENFENSPWGDRLFCYHASFQEFFNEIEESYDVIVSNPPFFTEDFKSDNPQRSVARFEDALPFEHLLYGVSRLLSKQGRFAMILPYTEEESILNLAATYTLFPEKITRVRGAAATPIKRSMIVFGRSEKTFEEEELTIEISRHQYTPEYVALTKAFYLKM
ncbi:tRNA1(Val) (adenine(37)-N6)-methyltransferase [Aquimarina intermedia]|uniref:tRNA1(Val) (adenine(37)-N6)-methyltransferase n=1 Tax=Aquimarina intermedia TaxID=350814 RepID=A0A5S5CCZ6_9FLAO|nr:methyltransferase [Aquimarina intermedia]TYP77234.1 tRNA1Val (adenine37-N6)-methyltransferase [Aquimarina intermedia]